MLLCQCNSASGSYVSWSGCDKGISGIMDFSVQNASGGLSPVLQHLWIRQMKIQLQVAPTSSCNFLLYYILYSLFVSLVSEIVIGAIKGTFGFTSIDLSSGHNELLSFRNCTHSLKLLLGTNHDCTHRIFCLFWPFP